MARFKYLSGTGQKPPELIPDKFKPGKRVLWPINFIRLNLVQIEGRDYAWAIQHIKQYQRMNGKTLPAVWFPGVFGCNCDVLYWDDERMILQNGQTVFELLNTKAKA